MSSTITLISHHLCPYVQRAVISLLEKNVEFDRIYVELANKPEWFKRLSPFGKVPVLLVRRQGKETVLFESAVILEYLEETERFPLYPSDPHIRAEHRAWIAFGSATLDNIARLYLAPDWAKFDEASAALHNKFEQIERHLNSGPFFSGLNFSLVDAVYGPVFRYFDVFDQIGDFGVFTDLVKTASWRKILAERLSIQQAVSEDYNQRLIEFLTSRNSHISTLIARPEAGRSIPDNRISNKAVN